MYAREAGQEEKRKCSNSVRAEACGTADPTQMKVSRDGQLSAGECGADRLLGRR